MTFLFWNVFSVWFSGIRVIVGASLHAGIRTSNIHRLGLFLLLFGQSCRLEKEEFYTVYLKT